MSTLNADYEALDRMAKFPKGEHADPTQNMTDEQKAKWKAMNEEHGSKFKQGNGDMLQFFADNPDMLREKQMRDKRQAAVKVRKWFEPPRGFKPTDDWYEKAERGLMEDRSLEVRGLKDKILMAAWDAGYASATSGDRFYRDQLRGLLLLADKHGLKQKAMSEFADGESAGKESKMASIDELAVLDMELTAGSIPHVALERDAAALEQINRIAAIERSANRQVAMTILDQMGGQRRLSAMLGVQQFLILSSGDPGIAIKWPNRQASKGNYVEVRLAGDDTYTMEFFNVSVRGKKSVKKFRGVYADMLRDTFERQTGWYLRLGSEQMNVVVAGEDEKESKFEEGESADPTENMSPEDAKKWRLENLKNKDKFKTASANYLLSLAPDGAAMVDGMVDEVLFGMILARVLGLRANQVVPANFKIVSVRGRRMTFREALEEMLQFNSGSQQYDIRPKGRNTYLVRNVNVGKVHYDNMTDEEEAEANFRAFGVRSATFDEGSRIPDGWDPGYVEDDPEAVEDDEGSQIPDGQGNVDKRAADGVTLYGLVLSGGLMGATENWNDARTWSYWSYGDRKLVTDEDRDQAVLVDLYGVPLPVAEQLVDVGTRASRLNPMMAFRMAKPYMKGKGHKLAASRMPWDYNAEDQLGRSVWRAPSPNGDGDYVIQQYADNKIRWTLSKPGARSGIGHSGAFRSWERAAKDAEDHAFGKGRWKNRQASAKEAASGLYGQTKEVWEVSWSKSRGEVTAVHKTHGPERWDTKVHEKYVIPMSEAEYNRTVADIKRKHGRSGPKAEKAAYEAFVKMKGAKKVATTKEAALGLYGYAKKVQADCESSVRKLQRAARQIASSAYGRNAKVAEFLSTHARRADSTSAHVLVAALNELGPKVASEMARTARLEELRAQRGVQASGVSEAKKLIKKYLAKGKPFTFQDVYEDPSDPTDQDLYKAFSEMVKDGEINGPDPHKARGNHTDWKYQKKAAGPQGKAQQALMEAIEGWPKGHSDALTDIARGAAFRGVHFAKIMSAAEALDKKGLLSFDGVKVTKKAGKTASGSGAANAKYLNSIPAPQKIKILKAVAQHYGISPTEAWDEVTDRDAEALYEYIPGGMAHEVLRGFRSMRLASDKEARSYGMYGYHDKVASLGLQACSDVKAAAGRIAADLHRRRAAKHKQITAFLDEHHRTASCRYSRMLHASYPEESMRLASAEPRTVQAWLEWDDEA